MTTEEYTGKLSWTLDQKISHFWEVIDTYYHRMDGMVYVSFSGGKDSTVMMHLIDQWLKMTGYPPVPYVFNNTTNEHQEILDFVKTFGDKVEWIRPHMTFAQSLLKNGYPVISKSQAMAISRYRNTKREDQKVYRLTGIKKDGTKGNVGVISKKWHFVVDAPFKVTEQCCEVLKKLPVKKYERRTKRRPIIGTMAEESNTRRVQYIKDGGCITWKEGKEMCKPLSIFTEKDIWDIIKRDKIEICSIYFDQEINGVKVTGEKRTGCAYCAFGCHLEPKDNNRYTRLYHREPKRYLSMMDKLGFRDVLEFMGINLPDKKRKGEQLNIFDK